MKTELLINCLKQVIHILEEGQDFIDLEEKDFYWTIDSDKIYNPYLKITDKDLSLGQLSFDISFLEEKINSKEPIIVIDFKKISSILQAISNTYS